jgi:hydroxymethylpyrimidine/phosphomethylpyrimidine kinase
MGKNYTKVLTIGGSDSGGGAGIQADLKTFSALGCFGMSIVTALTAQNTTGVSAIHAVPPEFTGKQLEAVFSDMGVDAVKIGMLYSADTIHVVARKLRKYSANRIVLDPVMVAQGGRRLLRKGALETMKEELFPMVTILAPNIPEAEILLNRKIHGLEDMHAAARDLGAYGSRNLLIKGGHLKGVKIRDLLFQSSENRATLLEGDRVISPNNHGTGCTHSAAMASFLAKGLPVEEAARQAKNYVMAALRAGAQYEIGRGCGPLHHYYEYWQ